MPEFSCSPAHLLPPHPTANPYHLFLGSRSPTQSPARYVLFATVESAAGLPVQMYTEDITIVGQSYRTGLSLNGQYPPVHPFGDCPRQFATGGLAELNAILAIDFSPAFELILAGAELLHWYSRALLSVAPRCQATNSWLSKSPVLPVARPTPPTWYWR